jgi:hypothetical protein
MRPGLCQRLRGRVERTSLAMSTRPRQLNQLLDDGSRDREQSRPRRRQVTRCHGPSSRASWPPRPIEVVRSDVLAGRLAGPCDRRSRAFVRRIQRLKTSGLDA